MIYIDPKKIIAKYINDKKKGKSKGGEKIFPVVARMLDHKYREIRQAEDNLNLYKQERAYVINLLKDNFNKDYNSRSQIRLSHKSLHSSSSGSLPKIFDKKSLSPSNTDLNKSYSGALSDKNIILSPSQSAIPKTIDKKFSIKTTDHMKKTSNTLKNYFDKNYIPRGNSLQTLGRKRKKIRLDYDSQDKANIPNEASSHLPILAKDHIAFSPKGKNRIMRDYYFFQVKSNFSPSQDNRKQLEASLRYYISKSKKTFKDFKTEKFLEQQKTINKHRY